MCWCGLCFDDEEKLDKYRGGLLIAITTLMGAARNL